MIMQHFGRFLFKFLIVLHISVKGARYNLMDLSNEIFDATKGALESLPTTIPTPGEFFELSKNVVIGFPYQIAFELINRFCTAALSTHSIIVKKKYTPDVDAIAFILKTKTVNISAPITNPTALWLHKEFRMDFPLVLFITGWKTNLLDKASEAQETMFKAYSSRGNVNFVVLDTAAYVDTLYAWSAFNTELIGSIVGAALQKLVESYPFDKIHLLGHSLGAHICGTAGRHFHELTQLLLLRITGLDPANPCFNQGETLSGLFRGDAQFVDVIHTNPGALGKRDAVGDIDFYCNGFATLQPGCFSIHCSHRRAWEYYAETVYLGNENNFLAVQCTSMLSLNSELCHGNPIPMGYAVPTNSKGNYFLKTNDQSPYGVNDETNTKE